MGVLWGGMVEHMRRCVSGCGVGRDGGAYEEVCQWVWCGEGWWSI